MPGMAERAKGKAKATGNRRLQVEGAVDRAQGKAHGLLGRTKAALGRSG